MSCLKPFFLFVLLISLNVQSQVYINGVFNTPYYLYNAGDTAVFCGTSGDSKDKSLQYVLKSSNEFIPAKYIMLQLNEVDFWDVQQFYYSSYEIISNGWQTNTRKKLEQNTLALLAKLESENRLYNDPFVEDYLQRLVQKIHSPEFFKGRGQFFNVKILNADDKICYAFDNGTILISTQLIAESESEKELFRILTEAVGHVLLNSNMDNLDEDSKSEYNQLGAIYPESTKQRVRLIAEKYLSYYEKRTLAESYSPQVVFFNSIASVISYTAWQDYYSQQYKNALFAINKLVGYDIANSTDYLLNAKIYLKLTDSADANRKALEYLKKASEFTDQPLPEIYSEMGIALIREKQFEQAKESFQKYHEMVVVEKDEEKKQWALKLINYCDVLMKLNDTRFEPSDNLDVLKIEIID